MASSDEDFSEAKSSAPKSATTEAVDNAGDVCRVAIRAIPFYPNEPAMWFSIMEGQFLIANIRTDITKFYYIIGMSDHQYACEVKDIISSPPAEDKYEKLKSELIKRLTTSKERKVKQLLDHEELGDRKPSQFLRHLQHLAGPEVPTDFIKTIWTSRLPRNMQQIIASQSDSPLEKLADLADKIDDIVPAVSSQVASASRSKSSDRMDRMERNIKELCLQVNSLVAREGRSRIKSNNTDKGSQRRRSRSRSRAHYDKYPICWYHGRFGPRATKCIKPCDYSENEKGGQ